MKLTIKPSVKISELNNSFNNFFQFLKLEFFKTPHTGTESTPAEYMIRQDLKLDEIPGYKGDGILEFDPLTEIQEIEAAFRDRFGLNVQVFRKSGNIWLETCGSDEMSLYESNEMGKRKSKPFVKPSSVDFDYD